MSAATCASLAQIMPVFVVALIAERIAFRRTPGAPEYTRNRLTVMLRILIDLALALALLAVTALALIGVELDGLYGRAADAAWIGAGLLATLIVYRWLLLSTPLLSLLADASEVWTRAIDDMLDSASTAAEIPIRVLGAAGDVVLTALSAGLFPVAETLASGVERAIDALARLGRRR